MIQKAPTNVKEFIILSQIISSWSTIEFSAMKAKELAENWLLEVPEEFKDKLEELASNY